MLLVVAWLAVWLLLAADVMVIFAGKIQQWRSWWYWMRLDSFMDTGCGLMTPDFDEALDLSSLRELLLTLTIMNALLAAIIVLGIFYFWPRRYGASSLPLDLLKVCRFLCLCKAALCAITVGEFAYRYVPGTSLHFLDAESLTDHENADKFVLEPWYDSPYFGSKTRWLWDLLKSSQLGLGFVTELILLVSCMFIFLLIHRLISRNQAWRSLNVNKHYQQ